jgi:hypothetical protein
VRKEVEECRKRHPKRPVIIINVDNALQDSALTASAQEWLGYEGKIWLDESDNAVETGIASEQVVACLATAPTRATSNVKWRWAVRAVMASLAALVVVAGAAAWSADKNAKEADRQRVAAESNLQRAKTGETLAQQNEKQANREAERARSAEADALAQKTRAEDAADKARKAEKQARAELR